MGLSIVFESGPGTRGVGDIANDGLPSGINMHVLNRDLLFAASSQLGQRIDLSCESAR